MEKYKVGDLVALPNRIKHLGIAKVIMWIGKQGGRIMMKFKVGSQVELPEEKYPNVQGIVIFLDEKNDKYLVRFNGTQQLYFTENELRSWDQ
ncbi:hypothetical protein OIT44_06580 [Weissella ceti]|uniref:Uncharacterized protein n=1 Tax=Weissella ceti TaxID=759620 RepID=A0ABT3E5M5_9LACO|nr:hypothetical protein [Weissella ceti]MCW0953714.1 hypothetical protein [Weissella ceti]QVK12830.1 hypothetical protein KHQ31_00135 [Weissella ceti]